MYSIAEYAFDCQRTLFHICYDHEAGLVVEAIVRVGHLPQAGFGLRSWPSMPRLYSTSTVYPSAWYAGSCFSRYMANLAQMQRLVSNSLGFFFIVHLTVGTSFFRYGFSYQFQLWNTK